MNVEFLHQFVASVPGSFGDQIGRRMAVNMVAAGRVGAAGALVALVGPDAIGALVEAGAPPAILRAAIHHTILSHYHSLWGVDRAAFTAWCRQAAFEVPLGTPETVDLYRGTMGVSPAVAAAGLHWSRSFDIAASYACRFTDRDGTGVIVLHARVPRDRIAMFVADTAHQEVIPSETPTLYEVITDKSRIAPAAAREVARCNDLIARGMMVDTDTVETGFRSKSIALMAQARMAAAGVLPGTAIVA